MAKPLSLSARDLAPSSARKPQASTAQRGALPSSEFVPLQFKMPPDFVKDFKQAALDRGWKLNQLLAECFHEFMKDGSQA